MIKVFSFWNEIDVLLMNKNLHNKNSVQEFI